MKDLMKMLDGLQRRTEKKESDRMTVNPQAVMVWKEEIGRFLRLEMEKTQWIHGPYGPQEIPCRHVAYDEKFILCCVRYNELERMKESENKAGNMIQACYEMVEALVKADAFAGKAARMDDFMRASLAIYNNHLSMIHSRMQNAVSIYDYMSYQHQNDCIENMEDVLRFIGVEGTGDPCICDLPRAWEMLAHLEQAQSVDKKTWSWLSGVMEEFDQRGSHTEEIAALIGRIEERIDKRMRIIKKGGMLREWLDQSLSDAWFEALIPDRFAETEMTPEEYAGMCSDAIRKALEALPEGFM